MTSSHGKKIRNVSTLAWIIGTFILTNIFNNDLLSIIVTPKIIKIDSINELNQFGLKITTIINTDSYAYSQNLVILF